MLYQTGPRTNIARPTRTPTMPPTLVEIDAAAAILRAGGLVAFPTETVYGLGANALDPAAVARIFAAKGRPSTNPLIVHVADASRIPPLVDEWPPAARILAERFWPGPLTVVVRRSALVPDIVTGSGPTVALRIPGHPVALALLRAAGVPVAAPSANPSGGLSPTTAEHVRTGLTGKYDLLLDGGPCPGGLESTVVAVGPDGVRLLRPGLIGLAQLEEVVGPVETDPPPATPGHPAPSPGLLTRHYAPRTALECVATPADADFLTHLYETAGLKVARYACPPDPAEAAARLYADLHALDAAAPDRIIALLPPDTEAWHTVRDRLARASAEE